VAAEALSVLLRMLANLGPAHKIDFLTEQATKRSVSFALKAAKVRAFFCVLQKNMNCGKNFTC
jgi:hypothetical protein